MASPSPDAANAEALARILSAEPILTGSVTAQAALGLGEGELGHAGPPFDDHETLPETVRNALAGAAVLEGWAADMEEGRRLVEDREVRLHSNHALGTVSPMVGVVRPSQPLMRVENRNGSGVTYATFAESGRQALRFGVFDDAVFTRLHVLEAHIAPAVAAALPREGLPILPLLSEAVELGDDVHQRNIGGMYAFLSKLPELPGAVRTWLADNPQHFLNYAMASAKLCLDQARGVKGSSLVVALSRNGLACGVQLAGTGDRWFTAPAEIPVGGFYPPYGLEDAQPDLGDSAIMEAFGLGGTAAHAAPQMAKALGVSWASSVEAGQRQRSYFCDAHPDLRPFLAGAEGLGVGLDARRVKADGAGVRIHTGIAHRDGNTGWIGVGVATAPVACFRDACNALDEGPVLADARG
jgi:hypothetical protein